MKPSNATLVALCALLLAGLAWIGRAQDKPANARFEYAIIKWDGPDRIYYNLPGKFELVHLEKQGIERPRDSQEEEYYLAVAANRMAREGWEAVNLNSRRILMRRPVAP